MNTGARFIWHLGLLAVVTNLVLVLFFSSIAQAGPALVLSPLSKDVWGDDWSGGCWFQRDYDATGGGELMALIRGEGKGSEILLNLDGQAERIPFRYLGSQSREFRLNARYSSIYQNETLKILVTTIVTEVPQGNECGGDCMESSGFAAEIRIQKAKLQRTYKFRSGACGL